MTHGFAGSLYTRFVSGFVFPLHERLKGHDSVRRRRELEASQWWGREAIAALQAERLRRFIEDIHARVPYYRRLLDERGLRPGDIERAEDLRKLPFLTKADIRANLDGLKAEDARGLGRFNTGGSTGEPLVFFIGRERVSHDVAAKWRATRWWGVDIGDPEAVVWGSPVELGAQDRVRELRDRLLRTQLLPAFEMSDARVDGYIAALERQRPRMVFGYPSALAHIARCARERGRRLDRLGVRVAFVTAERLYDEQRELIGETFACPVANGYGGRDAGFVAHECPEGGMHVAAEDIIVETISETGERCAPGQAGELVVTHLATRDFPFVRYRTGDVAVLGEETCACGRALPLIRELQGRTTDFVVAADGTVMHGLALIYVLRDIEGIRQFQIVQESLERTRILLATDERYERGADAGIEEAIRKRLGAGVRVELEHVAAIPPERSGKHRHVVSRVARDPQARGRPPAPLSAAGGGGA